MKKDYTFALWLIIGLLFLSLVSGCATMEERFPNCVGEADFDQCVADEREYIYQEMRLDYLMCRDAYEAAGVIWVSFHGIATHIKGDTVPNSTLGIKKELMVNNCRVVR